MRYPCLPSLAFPWLPLAARADHLVLLNESYQSPCLRFELKVQFGEGGGFAGFQPAGEDAG